MTDAFLSLSFVVPVYRGEKHLPELVARQEAFRAQLESSGASVRLIEAIFVCDEPVDGSAAVLATLARDRPWMSVIHLSKNSGQHAATAAGMLHTSGDWVVTMDEDGQHDPFRVPALFEAALPRNFDICYAASASAVHSRWWRNASSRLAKRLTAWVVADPFVPLFNSFRLIRGELARAAGALAGHDLYLDVALRWLTDRTCTAPIEMKDPRVESSYRLGTLLAHFRRLVMTYHPPFFRWIPVGGFLFALGFALLGVGVAVDKVIAPDDIPVRGWASTFVLIACSAGASIFMFGLILERQTSTMSRAQGRPAFMVVDRSKDALWRREPALSLPALRHETV